MSAPKILVFSGSSREGSLNTKLATLAARKLRAAGAEVTQISLADYPAAPGRHDRLRQYATSGA